MGRAKIGNPYIKNQQYINDTPTIPITERYSSSPIMAPGDFSSIVASLWFRSLMIDRALFTVTAGSPHSLLPIFNSPRSSKQILGTSG